MKQSGSKHQTKKSIDRQFNQKNKSRPKKQQYSILIVIMETTKTALQIEARLKIKRDMM
jgi:hypothetical protein